MADLDQLDQAALRDDEEEEDNYDDEDQHPKQLPQQQDDWDDSDREEIDVPNASEQYSPPSKTTQKMDDDDEEEEEREILGLDKLFASKSSSTTANAQAADLQELPYTRLYQAWARESRSPELLPLDQVTVEALREAIADVDPDEPQEHHHHNQHV